MRVYRKGAATAVHPPDKLVKELTAVLEMSKEQWPAPLIRKLADALLDCQESRGLSPHHEARWFNLLGFCLRPGFGDAVDDWRLKEVWKLYPRGIQFPRQAQCRLEWWVFWRRVAGGLTAGQQWHIYQQLSPTLPGAEGKKGKATKSPKKLSPQEWFEVMMALANFERLPVETKVALGRLLLENIRNVKPKPQELWAISRLGARVPFYGPLDRVIPAKEVAAGWRVFSLQGCSRRLNWGRPSSSWRGEREIVSAIYRSKILSARCSGWSVFPMRNVSSNHCATFFPPSMNGNRAGFLASPSRRAWSYPHPPHKFIFHARYLRARLKSPSNRHPRAGEGPEKP